MNTRKLFLTSLLAAATMSATAWADESVAWGVDSGRVYKWTGTAGDNAFATPSNWVTGTYSDGSVEFGSDTGAPSRGSGTGYVLYFDSSASVSGGTAHPSNTSDGGGIWVTGTGNTVTASMGQWAGSIQVDAGNVLNTSWSTQLKDGKIVANGNAVVNVTSGNLNFDQSGVRTWYTGENGQINIQAATGISNSGSVSATGLGTVTFSALTSIAAGSYVEAAGATVDFNSQTVSGAGSIKLSSGTIQNLTVGSGMTLSVIGTSGTLEQVTVGNGGTLAVEGSGSLSNVTFSAGSIFDLSGATLSSDTALLTASGSVTFNSAQKIVLSSSLTSGTYKIFDAGTNLTDWTSLGKSNIDFVASGIAARGTTVSFANSGEMTITVGSAASLTWVGTEASHAWDYETSQNWTNNTSADYFYANDNVTFDSSAENKTVSIGGNLDVGTITVSADGYTFSATDDATITSGAITVSAADGLTLDAAQDKTLTFSGAFANGSNKVVEITKTGAGMAVVSNAANKIAKVAVSAGTLELYGETSDSTGKGVESFNVASGATLSIRSNDMARWSSAASYDISGTLALNDKRVSIGASDDGDLFKLNGGTITGTGDGNGALDFFASRVVNVSGESAISAKIRVRDASNCTVDFKVAQESSLALSSELILGTADKTIKKSGAGTLNFTSSTKSGNSTGTFEQAAGTTNITAGTKNLSTVKVTGGTLNISGGTTTATYLSVSGGTTTISGGTTSTTNGTTVGNGGVLEISTGGETSALRGTLTINSGGKVKLMAGDATGWGGTDAITKLVLNEGAELYITEGYGTGIENANGKNQTFNMSGGIELTGAKITGTTESGKYSKFDLYNADTGITVRASSVTSEIATVLGLRKSGSITVEKGTTADGVDLLISGMLTNYSYVTTNQMDYISALTKSGAGTMKLTGDNQYWTTGGTIEEGTLIAAHENALGKLAAEKSLTVKSDANLQVLAGTKVNLGTAGNGVVLESGAKLIVDLTGVTLSNAETRTFEIMTAAVFSLDGTALESGDVTDSMSGYWEFLAEDTSWIDSLKWTLDSNTLSLTITAIPEPSVFGLLAGLGALALAGTRRRRRKA